MDVCSSTIRDLIIHDNIDGIIEFLRSGLNPNYKGGWPIRLAARHGLFAVVKLFIQFGADPHLLSGTGASTLQLAVFSGKHWNTDNWIFLLSYCDSSQLADGAAVAIVFKNVVALKKILATGRCNVHVPTSLTGKTLDQLAKGYKVSNWLEAPGSSHFPENEVNRPLIITTRPINSRNTSQQNNTCSINSADRDASLSLQRSSTNTNSAVPNSPRNILQQEPTLNTISPSTTSRTSRPSMRSSPHYTDRNLSPSVVRFFNQSVGQSSLTPRQNIVRVSSPTCNETLRH
ncbi:uncharacterized protein LOC101737546 [Bombyx mori]|uniref:Uncharacterized protein n=1 Tax=Bombyx mori TaxID=7091 RepID=A0A8R2DLK8_BOMMO|nr:uncharacterized protein LOC101737546 [Bombyx mori]